MNGDRRYQKLSSSVRNNKCIYHRLILVVSMINRKTPTDHISKPPNNKKKKKNHDRQKARRPHHWR